MTIIIWSKHHVKTVFNHTVCTSEIWSNIWKWKELWSWFLAKLGAFSLTNPKFGTDVRSECPLKSRKHQVVKYCELFVNTPNNNFDNTTPNLILFKRIQLSPDSFFFYFRNFNVIKGIARIRFAMNHLSRLKIENSFQVSTSP